MRIHRHSHRLVSSFAAILTFITAALVSLSIASAQTRIISVSGDLDFGSIPFGAASERLLIIGNAGDSLLTISNLVFSPPATLAPATFHGNFFGQLPPGANAYLQIIFTPTVTNLNSTNDVDFPASLTVNSDATSGTNTVLISATGTYPPANPSLHLDFGAVPLGSSHTLTLLLTNTGTVPVTVSNVVLPDGFSYYFGATNGNGGFGGGGGGFRGGGGLSSFSSLGPTLAPGSATNLFIFFVPSQVGIGNSFHVATISSDATNADLILITPQGNATNSGLGLTVFTVSATGTYPSGKYAGLFMPTNNPSFENSGYFTADSNAKGKLNATLTLAGKRYPFSAQLSASGAVSATIARKNLPALNVSLQFGRGWVGTIDDGFWTARLFARETPILSKNSLRAFPAGKYTFTIAGSTNSSLAPTTPGTGNLDIKISGATRVTGTLGDGTSFSQNTMLAYSQIPFYASLYRNHGALLGWINFEYSAPPPSVLETPIIDIPRQTNIPVGPVFPPPTTTGVIIAGPTKPPMELVSPDSTFKILSQATNQIPLQIVGTLNWFKPAGIDSNYPDGFSFQTSVSGSVP